MKDVQHRNVTNDLESEKKKAQQLYVIGVGIMLVVVAASVVALFR
jgi:glucose uptake protein GlcU